MSDTSQPFLTPEQVAELLQVPVTTLYGWRYKGIGPDGAKVGRHLRYRKADVDRWFEDSKRST